MRLVLHLPKMPWHLSAIRRIVTSGTSYTIYIVNLVIDEIM
jgi:hypothetical protein